MPDGPPPKKLTIKDLKTGSGAPATEGDDLSARYFRFGYVNHEIYEDQWHGDLPLNFRLGSGQAVPSWELGLRGMKAGGRRELIVPAKLDFNQPDQIYVIDLLSVKPPNSAASQTNLRRIEGTGPKPQLSVPPGPAPKKLVVKELKEGSGRGARRDERLGVRYVAINHRTGKIDDRWNEDPPYSFVLGEGDIREGWEIALPGTKLGERLELILPSKLAYGDGPMTYVVELIETENRAGGRG